LNPALFIRFIYISHAFPNIILLCMRKINVYIILLVLFAFVSCKRTEGPETVTRKFANHFALKEYEEAKQYGTENTRHLMEMMQILSSIGYYPPEDQVDLIEDKDVQCTISGDTAICIYMEYGEPAEITLVRQDNKWLVDFPLDDFKENEDWYENEDQDTVFEEDDEDEDEWEYDGQQVTVGKAN
jgi:hypothetical protein